MDPDGRVIREESPTDAPQVVGVPDGDFVRIDVPEVGELLATSTRVPTAGEWRIVLATLTDDIEDRARHEGVPAVTVLTVAAFLVAGVLTAIAIRKHSHQSAPADQSSREVS